MYNFQKFFECPDHMGLCTSETIKNNTETIFEMKIPDGSRY